jgi:hypothetical protein
MRTLLFALVAALFLAPSPARADVSAVGPSGFTINASAEVSAPPDRAWADLIGIGQWWNPAHTYSSDALHHMTLDARAGGCLCETWAGGSVEHARVLLAMEAEGVRTLRLQGALGPLQEMGVSGILTFTVAPNSQGARLTMTYRVAGDAGLGLDSIAGPVDYVLMEQFGRLTRYAERGDAN